MGKSGKILKKKFDNIKPELIIKKLNRKKNPSGIAGYYLIF